MTRARPLDLVLSRNRKLLRQCVKVFGQRVGFRIARDVTLQVPVSFPAHRELIDEPEYRAPGEFP